MIPDMVTMSSGRKGFSRGGCGGSSGQRLMPCILRMSSVRFKIEGRPFAEILVGRVPSAHTQRGGAKVRRDDGGERSLSSTQVACPVLDPATAHQPCCDCTPIIVAPHDHRWCSRVNRGDHSRPDGPAPETDARATIAPPPHIASRGLTRLRRCSRTLCVRLAVCCINTTPHTHMRL